MHIIFLCPSPMLQSKVTIKCLQEGKPLLFSLAAILTLRRHICRISCGECVGGEVGEILGEGTGLEGPIILRILNGRGHDGAQLTCPTQFSSCMVQIKTKNKNI